MAVSSQPVFVPDSAASAPLLEEVESGSLYVEDEEFPSELASNYDPMLQPNAHRVWPKLLIAIAVFVLLLGAVSVYTHYNPSNSGTFVFTGSR